jgi:hypothetical protein
MYVLKASCHYCGVRCSREEEDAGKLPKLYTPEIPFVREIVCGGCFEKIRRYYDQLLLEITLSKEKP